MKKENQTLAFIKRLHYPSPIGFYVLVFRLKLDQQLAVFSCSQQDNVIPKLRGEGEVQLRKVFQTSNCHMEITITRFGILENGC